MTDSNRPTRNWQALPAYALLTVALSIVVFVMIADLHSLNHWGNVVVLREQKTIVAAGTAATATLRAQDHLRAAINPATPPQAAKLQREKHAIAWSEAEQAMADLEECAEGWAGGLDNQRVAEVRDLFDALRPAVQKVVLAAGADNNLPAWDLISSRTEPLIEQMRLHLAGTIDRAVAHPHDEARVDLIAELGRTSRATEIAIGHIYAFVATSDPKRREQFDSQWNRAEASIEKIAASDPQWEDADKEQWRSFLTDREEVKLQVAVVFGLRRNGQWNLAEETLRSDAAPRVARIERLLAAVVASRRQMAQAERRMMGNVTRRLEITVVAAALLAVLMGAGALNLMNRKARDLSGAHSEPNASHLDGSMAAPVFADGQLPETD